MKIVDTLNVGDRMRFSLELAQELARESDNTVVVAVTRIEQDDDGMKVLWLKTVQQ